MDWSGLWVDVWMDRKIKYASDPSPWLPGEARRIDHYWRVRIGKELQRRWMIMYISIRLKLLALRIGIQAYKQAQRHEEE